MQWEKLLSEAVKDGQIRELYLRKLPLLRTTTNWKKVELIGWIDHQMKYTHYKGGLVKLNDQLYFVQDKTINALQQYMDWTFPRRIIVIKEEEKEKKKK
jgi:hypothetical protein